MVRGGRSVPLLAPAAAAAASTRMTGRARVSWDAGKTDAERVIKQGLLKLLNPTVDLAERKRDELDGWTGGNIN